MPLEELPEKIKLFLCENSSGRRGMIKGYLIKCGILKEECYVCGLESKWKDKPLVLIIDHINGINNDNRLENLRLLCPNCNSQTDTFCGKNISRRRKERQINCRKCDKTFSVFEHNVGDENRIFCSRKCSGNYNLKRLPRKYKIDWPEKEKLQIMVNHHGYLGTARILGVSDVAVHKRMKNNYTG